jgi:NAD(P)-dependent dehydrogenase (short-subunit alcohol dehydrogenase family)
MLADKVALVTGAGSGIGRATAFAMAREGARVVVSDITDAPGQETVRIVTAQGGQAVFVHADVTKPSDVQALVEQTVKAYGRLDCAHNNAGTAGALLQTHEFTEEDWDQVMAVNLRAVWLCMKYELIQMLKQAGGAIVNTGSLASYQAGGTAAYNTSKHGVLGLTRQAAFEYGTRGIRVNAVCPGIVKTPMVMEVFAKDPQAEALWMEKQLNKRFAEPEEIAEAVVYLCSDESSFITGTGLLVDGGWTAK